MSARPGLVRPAVLLALVMVVSALVALGGVRPAAAGAAMVSTAPPVVKGEATYGEVLLAGRGTWSTEATSWTYQWRRDGAAVPGADGRRYRLGLDDLGSRISVTVTAADASGSTATATSEETRRVRRAQLRNETRPSVEGVLRYGRTVEARPGTWSVRPTRLRYQWLSDGEPVRGATTRRYAVRPGDVGRRLRVLVRASAPGHRAGEARSPRRARVAHRVDVRRTVTYHVETRGRITTSLAVFRRQVQETYADARGWRGAGVRFRPVASGGRFTVVLAAASRVPAFSPVCSSSWSCRVGRYVVINQERWKHASPAWNRAGGALRDYRHMVVNHETGHWLGRGHAGCGGRGQPAPVMMQQSKGLDGCRFNAWPTLGELRATR